MKRRIIMLFLVLVLFMMSCAPALSDSYSLDLAVPFGVAHIEGKSSVPLYSKASTDSKKGDILDYQICEVISSQTIGDDVWFKISYYNLSDELVSGFVIGTDFYQLSLAGLIIVMSDSANANYLQKYAVGKLPFIGPIAVATTRSSPVSAQASGTSEMPQQDQYTFILNKNTKKFHLPSCSSINDMKSKNLEEYTGTRDSVINMGYTPCQKCKP